MFDIGWGELVVIGIVALIAIGPKELPTVLRTLGQYMGKVKRMATEFQGQFQEALREAELTDLKKQADDITGDISSSVSDVSSFDPLAEIEKESSTRSSRRPKPSPTERSDPPGKCRSVAAAAPKRRRKRPSRWSRREAPAPVSERRLRAGRAAAQDGRGQGMSHEDIEATKAPLMEHLIELRSRLIKAVLAFGVMFGSASSSPRTSTISWSGRSSGWRAPENSKFIYTALLEYFITQLKLAMFGAAFLSFPIVATQIYMFVAPGLYRHERKAFLPYLMATPIFFAMGALVVYFLVFPMLVRFSLHMQQPGEEAKPRSR